MSDMREALRHGDKTTTGGVLISTVEDFSHHGVRVAAEGDHATCPACKVGGPVINDAYPDFVLMDGRQILVRGARVMCQCANKPVVIPSQHDFTIEVNRTGTAASAMFEGAYLPSRVCGASSRALAVRTSLDMPARPCALPVGRA